MCRDRIPPAGTVEAMNQLRYTIHSGYLFILFFCKARSADTLTTYKFDFQPDLALARA